MCKWVCICVCLSFFSPHSSPPPFFFFYDDPKSDLTRGSIHSKWTPTSAACPNQTGAWGGMNRQPHGWLTALESTHLLVLLSCCVLGSMCYSGMALAQLAHTANLPPENMQSWSWQPALVAHQALQVNVMFPSPGTNSAKGWSQPSTSTDKKD